MIKERFTLIKEKTVGYVKEPWQINEVLQALSGKREIENGPSARWFMYFLSYVMLMAFGFTVYSVMAALFFSFIIMKVDFRKDFYYLNYRTRKDVNDESGTDTRETE